MNEPATEDLIAFVERLGNDRVWELARQVMPDKQYEVYLYRVGLEWKWDDIAKATHTTRQNVADLHARATKNLYAALVNLYRERMAA